jgi:hypothetical protein
MKILTTISCNNFTFLFLPLFLFGQFSVIAQNSNNEMHNKVYNLTSFSPKNKLVSDELLTLTPDEFESNPDFGYLPYDAPCENCYELIDKRTESYRYYVEAGSNGTAFYSQQCYGQFNVKNENNQWIAVDPRLSPVGAAVYQSGVQAVLPTELNLIEKQSSFNLPNGQKLAFNRKIELLYISPTYQISSLGEANWSQYTVGEEGIHIIDAWPNIDISITYDKDRIESSYIIKAPLGYTNGSLAFRDKLNLPSGYKLTKNNITGGYDVNSTNGKYIFNFDDAFGFDQSGLRDRYIGFNYHLDTINNQLSVVVPVSWLADIHAVYPLTVDPTVTASATYSAGQIYFQYSSGLYCPGDGTSGCSYTLNVPRPANSTLTSATFGMNYITGTASSCGVCLLSDAGVYFSTPCGRNPANVNSFWYCNDNTHYGTCSGSNIDISGSVTCLGPACSGNLPFTMYTQRCLCSALPNCNAASSSCAYMPNNSWTITVTGRTLETIANQTYNVATCMGNRTLNPGPNYGVPGYTYLWNTGATSSTVSVPQSGGPYSVVVTDACGVQRTVTFTINCPLSVNLSSFTAEKIDRRVLLQWETASEKDNDYFLLERAGEDGVFTSIGKTPAIGNSNTLQSYSYYDENPLTGSSYYRLKIIDKQGNESTSEIKSVGFEGSDELTIIPNPNKGHYQIGYRFPEKGQYLLELYSTRGDCLQTQQINMNEGYQAFSMDEVTLPKGVYFVKLHTKNQILIRKMIVE